MLDKFSHHDGQTASHRQAHIIDKTLGRCTSTSIGTVNGVALKDLPRVRITDDWDYEVRTPAQAAKELAGKTPREYLGKGDAQEAFRILLEHFPEGCSPATYQRGRGCCPPAA